jgi:hypothetical protein
MSRFYATLEEMLADRGIRQRDDGSFAEDSYDYGVWWRDEGGGCHRLTWIGARMRDDPEKAGELYLVCLSPPRVGVIGVGFGGPRALMVAGGKETGAVELLCVIPPAALEDRPCSNTDRVLDGWPDACGTEDSVAWVRERARAAIAGGVAYEPGKEPSHA